MKRVFIVMFCLVAFCSKIAGQSFDGSDFNGKVYTAVGNIITGDIYFEAATGKVIITNEEGSEYFTSRTASSFEFYDFEKNANRKFYSLLFNNNPTFFELLKETTNLALLTKENVSSNAIAYLAKSPREEVASDSYQPSLGKPSNSETLYLVDEKGNIKPYVVINRGEKTGTISSYVSPYLLSTLTRGKYQELRRFARENHYSLKDKEDLIEVLDFYNEIARK